MPQHNQNAAPPAFVTNVDLLIGGSLGSWAAAKFLTTKPAQIPFAIAFGLVAGTALVNTIRRSRMQNGG